MASFKGTKVKNGTRLDLGIKTELENTEAQVARSYYGPMPAPSVYRGKVTTIEFAEANRNGDPYYMVRLVIDHDDDEPKAMFNGFTNFGRAVNITINKQWMSYLRMFGDAVGLEPRFINAPVLAEDGKTVVEFGNVAVAGLRLRFSLMQGKPYKGRPQMEVKDFFPDQPDDSMAIEGKGGLVNEGQDEDDLDSYTGTDEFDPGDTGGDDFAESDGDDADPFSGDGDGDDMGDDAGDDDSGDSFDEPAPKKAPAKKAAPRKAASTRRGAF